MPNSAPSTQGNVTPDWVTRETILQIQRSLALLLFIILMGTVGYRLLEGWDWINALYMTLITITTVGYGEVLPLSFEGRIFTSILIICGVGTMGYALGSVTQFLVEGQINKVLGERKMEKELQSYYNHFIICGYGRVGHQVCEELKERNLPFIVLENSRTMAELAWKKGFVCLTEDATDEEALIKAGIKRAKALIAAISSDAGNVFITLSAKGLNPDIFVVVRVQTPSSQKKMLQAGADRVISPDLIGGTKMALAAIYPSIVEFMELVTSQSITGYRIEEIVVSKDSHLVNKSLKESQIRTAWGVMILGIKKQHKKFLFNPSASTIIEAGDILIAAGSHEQLDNLPLHQNRSQD